MRRAIFIALSAMVAVLMATAARAQMIPIEDIRECSATVDWMGLQDEDFDYPSGSWAYFESYTDAFVQHPDPEESGSCGAEAFQISEFFPNGINFSGSTGAGWYAIPGSYTALSYVNFKFSIDKCHQYQLDAWLEPGDLGESQMGVKASDANLAYESVTVPYLHKTGRIPPGTYEIEGRSYIFGNQENASGPTYSTIWTCVPCTTTLIAGQPNDRTIACGGTTTLTVTPTAPVPPGLTYQWRRNMVPLTNSTHIAGATTATLTINNTCTSDAGYYDVVLSDGTILEPSRLARLLITTAVTGVDVAETPERAFAVERAGANPFQTSTSFRYNAAKPQHARIAVYNAAGARVRMLVEGLVSGAGIVTWDGTTSAGVRAPAGIYFMRFEVGSVRENRKVVLLK